jgi:uncharacterized protein YdhG (YjbR/CyaY superfamily)
MSAKKVAKSDTKKGKKAQPFTAEERAAMKDYLEETRRTAKRGGKTDAAAGEKDVQDAIAKLAELDRSMAKKLHALIKATAPDLMPRTWYGMPAYTKDGNVLCHFQSASKFKTRYPTLGFSDKANLDDGAMWPVAFALTELNAAQEKRIKELIKRAIS